MQIPLKNGVNSLLLKIPLTLMTSPTYFTMASEFTPTVQPEDWRINVNDAWQVLWWCRYLGLTKTQLEKAISSVGNVVVDVKRHLALQQELMSDTPPAQAPSGASHITSRTALNRSPF